MTSRAKAVLGVIVIFFLGVATGVVGSSIFAQHKMTQFLQNPGLGLMTAMEQRLTRNLDLDANQRQQIHGYFIDNLRRHKQLQTLIQPQVQELNQTTVQQIRAALRPDQQQRFNQNLDDLRTRFWKYASSQDAGTPPDSAAQPNASSTNSDSAPQSNPPAANSAPASPPAPQ